MNELENKIKILEISFRDIEEKFRFLQVEVQRVNEKLGYLISKNAKQNTQ